MAKMATKLEDIVSLAKRRGFIYQGSEIYGGLAGTWDYGPLGAQLKRNIVNEWLKYFVDGWDDMYLIDTTILMNPKVWQASGHTETFNDPLIEDVKTKKRYRLDHLLKENGVENADSMSLDEMVAVIRDKGIKSPDGNELGNPAQFNLMFKTLAGPTGETIDDEDNDPLTDESDQPILSESSGKANLIYLRPETAQGMFTNYKNILDSFYPDLPFGLAQVGKTFRNEISPRDFIFRAREFEIMEFEFFIKPDEWEKHYEKWRKDMLRWFKKLGLDEDKVKEVEVPEEDRAHYSKRTTDFYYDFPSLGFDEIGGLAYRTDFDLKNHQEKSGKNLEYRPKDGGAPFIPHVIEPTFGVDRHVMAVLSNAYTQDEVNGEKRIYLKLPAHLAPIKVAVSPLLKNKPELVAKAKEVYKMLKKEVGNVMWDDNGNIGKRYRRQDEIGTPYCVTVDFQTLEDDTVTVRNRDTTEQTRTKIQELTNLEF
jgi:glycyl-tRNA synthetase